MRWLMVTLLLLSGLGLGVNIYTTNHIKKTFDTKLSLYHTLQLDAEIATFTFLGTLIISFLLLLDLHLGATGCSGLVFTAGLNLLTNPVGSFSISIIRYSIQHEFMELFLMMYCMINFQVTKDQICTSHLEI